MDETKFIAKIFIDVILLYYISSVKNKNKQDDQRRIRMTPQPPCDGPTFVSEFRSTSLESII